MTLTITKDDVGKKFKRRDGGSATITRWDERTSFPVCTEWYPGGEYYYRVDGTSCLNEAEYDLIERIAEESVSEFNWDKFNEELSKSTNICAGAKKDIKEAVATALGKALNPQPEKGQVWRRSTGELVQIQSVTDSEYVLADINNIPGNRWGDPRTLTQIHNKFKRDGWVFCAYSLKEYLANGGEL